MKLVPPGPPGRITRKARDFEADILQLRQQGYTLDAIRQGLQASGLEVRISTVRREALRSARTDRAKHPATTQQVAAVPAVASQAAVPAAARSGAVDPAPSTWIKGRDFAESYMREHITNPLCRAKEKP